MEYGFRKVSDPPDLLLVGIESDEGEEGGGAYLLALSSGQILCLHRAGNLL